MVKYYIFAFFAIIFYNIIEKSDINIIKNLRYKVKI